MHARLRAFEQTIGAMLRTRGTLESAVHTFFQRHGFVHVHTPVLTSNDCEGAGETFTVHTRSENADGTAGAVLDDSDGTKHFFPADVHLTVSGQLHQEALAASLSRVYVLGQFGTTILRHRTLQLNPNPHHLAAFLAAPGPRAREGCLPSCCSGRSSLDCSPPRIRPATHSGNPR